MSLTEIRMYIIVGVAICYMIRQHDTSTTQYKWVKVYAEQVRVINGRPV